MALDDDAVITAAVGYIYTNTVGTARPTLAEIDAFDPETFGAQTQKVVASAATTLTVGAQATASLPSTSTAAAVQTALESLTTVGVGNVLVVGSTDPDDTLADGQRVFLLAIGRGIDLAVFHGRDALRNQLLQGIDTDNVIANTTHYKNLTAGAIMDGLLDGYDLVSADTNNEFDGWAVDPRFRSTLARAQVFRDANGNIDPARVNLNAQVGDILGLPAQYGRVVGGDLDGNPDTGLRLFGGDFSQLRYGFADQIRVKMTDSASISANADGTGAVSMWQTNQIAILIDRPSGRTTGYEGAVNLITATAIGLGLVLAPFASPIAAHAIPLTCEHRGTTHVERHGGIDNDNAYHVSRGELPNCDKGDADPHPVVTPTAPTTYVLVKGVFGEPRCVR